jgi:hypothetical protein
MAHALTSSLTTVKNEIRPKSGDALDLLDNAGQISNIFIL